MDIKELIKIIIEVVEKIKNEENQQVIGICFDKSNQEKLKEKISANKVFYYKDYNEVKLPDILYLDFISLDILPQVALGIANDNISSLIKKMLLNDKKIIVLGYEKLDVNNGYHKLFASYYKLIEGYGITFEDNKNKEVDILNNQLKFDGKVLTKKDIIFIENCEVILVEKSTVITDLAREEAVRKNITISRI